MDTYRRPSVNPHKQKEQRRIIPPMQLKLFPSEESQNKTKLEMSVDG